MVAVKGRVSGGEGQPRVPPYKYDIRVTGGLFADSSDNGTTTKVSVKILGNEDGDIIVEQDDSGNQLASPALSVDGDTRTPQFSQKRGSDGGLELHIRALPIKPRSTAQPAATLTGGGGGGGGANTATVNLASEDGSQLDASSRRASTRMSVASLTSRPMSSGLSVLEIRPAFDGASSRADSERECDSVAEVHTPQSLERSPELVLVGGGGGGNCERADSRPRSASIAVMEDKCTMTTWRGLPTEERTTSNSSRCSLPVTIDADQAFDESRKATPTPSVLRGGGSGATASRPAQGTSVFSAFNGPLVAPPEGARGGASTRPRSLPRSHDQLRPRRASKDKINYRERAENLLTQYFPAEVLERYLDELRRRYRFIGDGGMTNSEISKLLDETTADSQLKEQLRASLEELVKAPMSSGYSSDHEQTISSSPSQPHYLSIRETELRDVLDRTSVSPVPKGVRSSGPASVLVGGGMSMENLGSPNLGAHNLGTLRSDHISLAGSVHPAESVRGEPTTSSSSGGAKASSAHEPKSSGAQQANAQSSGGPSKSGGGPSKTGPGYWDDNEKYKVRPPNMAQAFTILKSQPIFVREMSSSDIKFKSPFSHTTGDSSPSAATEMPSMGGEAHSPRPSDFANTDAFAERHPAESKVAKAVSELEEVLRRTEAETLAGIASDFQSAHHPPPSSSKNARHSRSNGDNYDTESVVSRDSLVGGGASSRSDSASTRYTAIGAKFDNARSDSAFKMSASQSTIRTDVLLKEGMQFDDADNIDNEMYDEEEEAVVPVEHDSRNSSAVSLPMRLEDMPAELAAVLRRTGGIENARLRRTETPTSVSSAASHHRSPPPPSVVTDRLSLKGGALVAAAGNKSLTELDIVMGRTGGPGNRSVASSRTGTSASGDVLRGGSGTPLTPGDVDNELANVLRRTSGYAPSASSYAPSAASGSRSESVASDIKSVASPPEAIRQALGGGGSSTSASLRPGYSYSGHRPASSSPAKPAAGYSSPPAPPPPRAAAQPPPSRSAARSPPHVGPASYASSPLRAPPSHQQPAQQRHSPPPPPPPPHSQPAAPRAPNQQPRREERPASARRSPSPELYRVPTPVFGRFPSPPAYIKNRGNVSEAAEEAQANGSGSGSTGDASQPQPSSPSSRGRPHSQSVHHEQPRTQARQYQEEPVVERLDLETGSVASRRTRPPQPASVFGSASTLMNANIRENYELPKVVEEDVDSLASYPSSSRRARSPNLVGGGRLHPSDTAASSRTPSVLCGGGRVHHAFTEPARHAAAAAAKSCEAGCCGVCGKDVNNNDVVVRPQVMHASCLRCEACDCLLTSSTFRAINGHVYCESDYQRHFSSKDGGSGGGGPGSPNTKVVAVRPGISDKQFQEMNKAIMESFTSVDDFLQHMRQLGQQNEQQPGKADQVAAYAGDPTKVQRAGDVGLDRQTHYEREHVTSPSGTPWITERVVDKKVKTKVIEKRYPASAVSGQSQPPTVKCGGSVPLPSHAATEDVGSTLIGGGGSSSGGGDTVVHVRSSNASRMDAMRLTNHSSASRPSNALLNDTKSVNGWEHPMCPVCAHVVYQNDQVVHESYGYHKACMRCRQCSQVVPVTSATRIKGAIYCKKHGDELLRRRSILMRKKSTMGRRSRHTRHRSGVSSDRFVVADDSASLPTPPPPPPPPMPMFSSAASAAAAGGGLPAPPAMPVAGTPRRVTTAMRNFLDAAAEQIENQSLLPVPSEALNWSPAPSVITELPKSSTSRPLPQPKPRASGGQGRQQHMYQPAAVPNYVPGPPLPPPPPQSSSGRRPGSRSIFSGSRESFYDPNVVNALRQEAQRQINGSNGSLVAVPLASPASSSSAADSRTRRLLTPCGPSIADALHKYTSDGSDGRVSVSSQFDPFLDASHDQLVGGGGLGSPLQQRQQHSSSGAPNFSPNQQLDHLERRFRNANFRPPWALKSQTTFD